MTNARTYCRARHPSPEATLCLTSALARHHLIDAIPPVIDIAKPRELRQPRTAASIRWHRFGTSTCDIERSGLDVGAREAPRSCRSASAGEPNLGS
jgi:hypothetical protein